VRRLFPESAEEHAARLVETAAAFAAPGTGRLESAGLALPEAADVSDRISARLKASGIEDESARSIGASTANRGVHLMQAAGRGELRHDDLRGLDQVALEAVVTVMGRPSWYVLENMPETNGAKLPGEGFWLTHINNLFIKIASACGRVGSICIEAGGVRTPIGTGWRVGPRFLITNAHVAEHLFRRKLNEPADDAVNGWERRPGRTGLVNFALEHARPAGCDFQIEDCRYIQADPAKPDLAILTVSPQGEEALPGALIVERDAKCSAAQSDALLFTVGHPMADLRNDANVAAVFGALDGTKRFSPGESRGRLGDFVLAHDCSTVNGSSGSPVLDFSTGRVVGLHFWGLPGARNESVFLPVIAQDPDLAGLLGADRG
jgi:hypothetical protein